MPLHLREVLARTARLRRGEHSEGICRGSIPTPSARLRPDGSEETTGYRAEVSPRGAFRVTGDCSVGLHFDAFPGGYDHVLSAYSLSVPASSMYSMHSL